MRLLSISILTISFSLNLFSQELSGMEKIKYLSQKIAYEYLYYQQSHNVQIKSKIQKDIGNLENSLRESAKIVKHSDKDILNFIAYSKDEIKELLKKDPSPQNQQTMLDISDSLYEGIKNIDRNSTTTYKTHLYALLKLYLSLKVDDENQKETKKEMNERLILLGKNYNQIKAWQTLEKIVSDNSKPFMPNLVYLLSESMDKEIKR